jgi:hypothetical protein
MVEMLGAGVWHAYRKTTYKYAGTGSKCLGPIKYDVCEYFQSVQVYIQGTVGTVVMLDTYQLTGLKDGDWEVSGICWNETIGLVGKAAGAVPIPKHLSEKVFFRDSHTSLHTTAPGVPEFANLISHLNEMTEPKFITARISRSAFENIARAYVSTQGHEFVPLDLPSLHAGSANLAQIAGDLAGIKTPFASGLGRLFGGLSTTSVRASQDATPDDVWTLEATLAMRR